MSHALTVDAEGLSDHEATIFVNFAQIGFHSWPGASGLRAYLGVKHRHEFNVRVAMNVHHDDREVEFHDVKDFASAQFRAMGDERGDMGGLSCEMMARRLGLACSKQYARPVVVTVFEDRECGARVLTKP